MQKTAGRLASREGVRRREPQGPAGYRPGVRPLAYHGHKTLNCWLPVHRVLPYRRRHGRPAAAAAMQPVEPTCVPRSAGNVASRGGPPSVCVCVNFLNDPEGSDNNTGDEMRGASRAEVARPPTARSGTQQTPLVCSSPRCRRLDERGAPGNETAAGRNGPRPRSRKKLRVSSVACGGFLRDGREHDMP
jgi:hypothetical protein